MGLVGEGDGEEEVIEDEGGGGGDRRLEQSRHQALVQGRHAYGRPGKRRKQRTGVLVLVGGGSANEASVNLPKNDGYPSCPLCPVGRPNQSCERRVGTFVGDDVLQAFEGAAEGGQITIHVRPLLHHHLHTHTSIEM